MGNAAWLFLLDVHLKSSFVSAKTIGVILFQLGGPDSPEAIEPFLYNLFSDPEIINFPLAKIGRPALAKLISKGRARKVRAHYAEIGGASPIRKFTEQQAVALEEELRKSIDARVFVAMRYWHPMTDDAIERARRASCDELVLLPLYPQYSSTTTGSSLNEWKRRCRSLSFERPTHLIREFYDFRPYLDSLVDQINQTFRKFEDPRSVHLVFSAHSVPVSVIDGGDPYRTQIEDTVRLVMERGGWPNATSTCYQSKIGNRRWLQPSLHETISRLGECGAESVLVVPIAFVSDHVETLAEIDIEARKEAAEHGIRHFEMMPGLNDSTRFIQALAALVINAMGMDDQELVVQAGAADAGTSS